MQRGITMNLIKKAKEVHENAKAHGWWETKREHYEIIALIHSEVSEVLEEYRNNLSYNTIYYEELELSSKPCGIPIELADIYLRILDYIGYFLLNANNEEEEKAYQLFLNKLRPMFPQVFEAWLYYETDEHVFFKSNFNFAEWIGILHVLVSATPCVTSVQEDQVSHLGEKKLIEHLTSILLYIDYLCIQFKILNFEEALRIKHEYNTTRPYKHGGKKI